MRHAVAFEGVEHQLRVERRHHRMRIALDPVRHCATHVCEVKHGRGMQEGSAGRSCAFGAQGESRDAHVGMAQHHALGKACGAAGIEDAGQVFTSTQRIGYRFGFGQQGFVTVHARRHLPVAAIDHLAQTVRLMAELLDQRAERVVDQQNGRTRIVQRVQDLGSGPARIAGIQYTATPGHRHLVFEVEVGVERQHCHPIAGLHAELLQRARDSRHAIGKFAERTQAGAEPHRDAIRILLRGPLQGLGQVHALSSRQTPVVLSSGASMLQTGTRLHDGKLHRKHGKRPQSMTRSRSTPYEPATISIAFVHGMLGGVRGRGEACEIYLEDAGIAPELLDRPTARVTADQYVALFRSLTDRRDDDLLGFVSRPLRRGSIALIFRAAIGAATLETAMRRVAHTFGLLQDDVALEPVREGGLAGWGLRFNDPELARPTFLHEILLRVFWRFLAWLAGGRLPAARFDFAFETPPYAGSYGPVFPAPLNFGFPQSSLWFDAQLLQCPVRRDEAALRVFLADAQANIIMPRRVADVVSTRVRSHLRSTQPAWPGLAACADAMHMSTATLQRRLAVEGTSFQVLKDELRRDLAIVRLNTSTVSLGKLADELGFADSAAFQRAFKNWTGSAPGPYRRARA